MLFFFQERMIIPGTVFCRSWAAHLFILASNEAWHSNNTAGDAGNATKNRPGSAKGRKRVGLRVGQVSILCNTEPCQHETLGRWTDITRWRGMR